MSKSFRKNPCGSGRKPDRGYWQSFVYKIKRSSRRIMKMISDEEYTPIMPAKIGNKWPLGTTKTLGYTKWDEEEILYNTIWSRPKRKFLSLKNVNREDALYFVNFWYK